MNQHNKSSQSYFILVKLMYTVTCFVFLAGCFSHNDDLHDNSKANIDFAEVHWYATRASLAYKNEATIRSTLSKIHRIATVDDTDVQYFIELQNTDSGAKQQIISIRGTANIANALQDAEYVQAKNAKLDIYVHKGFDKDTMRVYADIIPYLDKNAEVILTGHSLGAAISTLLMMYLHEDGFTIGKSINFGQPKVTNKKGVEKYEFLSLTRIRDENDVVPLIPATTLVDSLHGIYQHLGKEVIILEKEYYVYENQHRAEAISEGSFWKDLGDESIKAHYMQHYLHNITSKIKHAIEIPYSNRHKYEDASKKK